MALIRHKMKRIKAWIAECGHSHTGNSNRSCKQWKEEANKNNPMDLSNGSFSESLKNHPYGVHDDPTGRFGNFQQLPPNFNPTCNYWIMVKRPNFGLGI